jgi:hypothetical protein
VHSISALVCFKIKFKRVYDTETLNFEDFTFSEFWSPAACGDLHFSFDSELPLMGAWTVKANTVSE